MILLTRHDSYLDVSTEPQYPLGSLSYEGPVEHKSFTTGAANLSAYAGGRVWRYVKNDGATAWVAGNIVTQKGSGDTAFECEKAPVSSIAEIVVGVAQVAVPAGSYAWVVREGDCEVLAGTETLDIGEGFAVSATDAGTGMECGAPDTSSTANLATSLLPFLRKIGFARENAAAASLARCRVTCVA